MTVTRIVGMIVTRAVAVTVTRIPGVTVTRAVALTVTRIAGVNALAAAVVTVMAGLSVIVAIVHHILLQSILLVN